MPVSDRWKGAFVPVWQTRRGFTGMAVAGIPLLLVALLSLPFSLHSQEPEAGTRKTVAAVFTESEIVIDGELDEAAWANAPPAKDFIQKEPSEGQPATEPTEVRVLYNNGYIYFGVYCYDRNPGGIVVNDISRDMDAVQQDNFGITLDTFDDDRNGYTLITSPRGGQRDIQFFNEGRDENENWDGVWYVETRIHEDGWSAEFAIPFKTLRFRKEDFQVWGVQFFRRLRRRNELSHWVAVPRRYGNYAVSLAGDLKPLEGVTPGRNLKIKPFVLGGVNRFASRGKGSEGDFDGGLDVKYGLTSGLTLDLTVNTDFSQVEADVQQVNLTRFSLFFPEKREFFLENAGVFQFGENYRLGPPRSQEVILFFSRRIGLSEAREPLPLLGGARLTGRAGPYYLGLMNIQSRSEGETPANNFTVARLRRDIFSNSDVGVMLINRDSSRPDDHNRTFGADANFLLFRQNLRINTLLAKTDTPGLQGDDMFGKVEASWQGTVVRTVSSYQDIQKNFNPEIGFVRRPGRRILHNEFALSHRLQRESRWGSFIRNVNPMVISDYAILPGGRTETKFLRPQLRLDFQDGGAFEGQYIQNFERLGEPFDIRRDGSILIPAGDYRFNEFLLWYFTDRSAVVGADVRYKRGDFFSGTKTTWETSASFKPGYRFSASLDYDHNDIELREGAFSTDLVGLRVNYSFNPRMFLNALLQYNTATHQISSNIRFRLIHRPLSDLFIVYNDQHDTQRELADRTLTLKYTHLFDF